MTNFIASLPTPSRYDQVSIDSTNFHTYLLEWK